MLAVNLFYCERKYFSTPLGGTVAFVRPRLTYAIPLMAITGMRGTAGGRHPAAANPPLVYLIQIW